MRTRDDCGGAARLVDEGPTPTVSFCRRGRGSCRPRKSSVRTQQTWRRRSIPVRGSALAGESARKPRERLARGEGLARF